MSKKVTLELTVKVVVEVNKGVDMNDLVNELDYNFTALDEYGSVVDTEIKGFEIL